MAAGYCYPNHDVLTQVSFNRMMMTKIFLKSINIIYKYPQACTKYTLFTGIKLNNTFTPMNKHPYFCLHF